MVFTHSINVFHQQTCRVFQQLGYHNFLVGRGLTCGILLIWYFTSSKRLETFQDCIWWGSLTSGRFSLLAKRNSVYIKDIHCFHAHQDHLNCNASVILCVGTQTHQQNMGITHYKGQLYLTLIDCGPSRFAVWCWLRLHTSENVIKGLQVVFECGAPERLWRDNNTAFWSKIFAEFTSRCSIISTHTLLMLTCKHEKNILCKTKKKKKGRLRLSFFRKLKGKWAKMQQCP